jgi:Protein of unknown function (DUF3499)
MDPCYGGSPELAHQIRHSSPAYPPVVQRCLLLFARMSGSGLGRQCSRSGCAERAVVTLTYEYKRSQVWLDALTAERDPHGYDLCRSHAARLSVPLGWHLADRRTPSPRPLLAG